MNAAIIAIGDELLIGQVINTNASFIAQQLNNIGIPVNIELVIGDDKGKIIKTLDDVSQYCDLMIITGGLGPTSDDITKTTLCEYFQSHLVFNEQVYNQVLSFISERRGVMNELNKSQAMVPDKCLLFQNTMGTAPGMCFQRDGKIVISMPGVPFEMEKMMNEQVIPFLKQKFDINNIFHRTILTTGIAESQLAEMIAGWEKSLPEDIKVAYLPSPGIVKVRMSAYKNPSGDELIKKAEESLKQIISEYIFGYDEDTLEQIVGNLLLQRSQTLSTAESCTGGDIARSIISVPGASSYFMGGIIAYSNNVKEIELKVNHRTIEKFGAVSKEVVEEMVQGCLQKFNTTYSVAVSGIAGPDGGTPDKPVGTVWIAVCDAKQIKAEIFHFGDNRLRNIQRATIAALNLLRKFILSNP
jgi:nicotinamide-nucleotide amidase